jgi:hypothetical protein
MDRTLLAMEYAQLEAGVPAWLEVQFKKVTL